MKIAVWNIGHFSYGNSPKTAIPQEKLPEAVAAFRDYIVSLDADLFAVCENTALFCNADKAPNPGPVFARDVLFDGYTFHYEGAQHRYSANALHAKCAVEDVRRKRFLCNEDAVITHTDLIRASDYYYLKGTLTLDGKPVTVIVCHLAFDMKRNPDTVNIAQLRELIEVTKSDERVLIAGDLNCRDLSTLALFREAGFALANDGSLLTCPQASENKALDHILVKGLTVKNPAAHETALSDHYALTAEVTLA
jgi:endonuclease/exonuclease/phosphatase family metal-dependent hydrolase